MRFINYIRKIFLKKKRKNICANNVGNISGAEEERILLKINRNNFKYLEWINCDGISLPVYYFIKDGKKYHYLNFYDKTMEVNGEKQRMFIVDRSLITIN